MFSNDLSGVTNPLNNILEERQEKFDYNSVYRAYVVSIDDPKEMGRVQVRIPSLHGVVNDTGIAFIKDGALPWAFPGIFAGGGNQIGSVLLPEVGGIVYVMFEYAQEGQERFLVYFGGLMTKKSTTIEKTIVPQRNVNFGESIIVEQDDLPIEVKNSKSIKLIYKSIKGSKVYIDDADGIESIYLVDACGQTIRMGNNGQPYEGVKDRVADDRAKRKSTIKIAHNDDVFIELGEEYLDIESHMFKINGDLLIWDPVTKSFSSSSSQDRYPIGKVELFDDNDDHSDYLGFVWQKNEQASSQLGLSAWKRVE